MQIQSNVSTVVGTLQRSATQFKRRSCYEIGDDVFSLSELECLVIRGKTSRPSRITLPFVAAPKKSKAYIIYALDATDYRINFLLVSSDLVSIALTIDNFASFIRSRESSSHTCLPHYTILLLDRTMVIFTTRQVSRC
jgi:hypothetical protein